MTTIHTSELPEDPRETVELLATVAMLPVESAQIEAIGHDPLFSELLIRFRGKGDKPGTLYRYRNFGETDWAAFRDAESKGSHFQRHIKPFPDRYPFVRVP